MEGLTTSRETRQDNHHRAERGGGDGQQGRSALAPSGAGGDAGLGARLANLLTADEQRRVNAAATGACRDQLALAEVVIRTAVASGKADSVVAFAVAMGKRAVRGEVGAPAAAAMQSAPRASTEVDLWAARATLAGRYVDHPRGVLIVEPDGRSMRHCGGKYVGSVVAGKDVLAIWARVESGELPEPTLQLPSSATAAA